MNTAPHLSSDVAHTLASLRPEETEASIGILRGEGYVGPSTHGAQDGAGR